MTLPHLDRFQKIPNRPSRSTVKRGISSVWLLTVAVVGLATLTPFATAQDPPAVPESGIDQDVLDGFDATTPAQRIEFLNLYDKLGNRAMVEALSEKILQANPDDTRALETLAVAALRNGNIDKSLAYTERLVGVDPTWENRSMRATALGLAGRSGDAVSILNQLKEENDQPVFTLQEDLAFALLETGQIEAAKDAFEEIVSTAGYTAAAVQEAKKQIASIRFDELIRNGDEAIKNKDAEAAREILENLKSEFPDSPEIRGFYANVLILEGRHSDALIIFENLKKEIRGKVFEFQNDIGYIFVEMKDWDVAREMFRDVLNTPGYSATDVAQARTAMGEIELYERLEAGYRAAKKRDRKTVREIADWANQHFPKNRDVRAFEAKALALEGDHQKALEILSRLETETPPGQPYENTWELGEALYETGDFKRAADSFDKFAAIPNRRPSERIDAFYSLANLKEDYFGQLRASATTFSGEEGDEISPEIYGRSPVSQNGWRADATYHRDEISLKDTALRDSRTGLQQGVIGFDKFFGNAHFVRARVGASDNDVLGGFSVGKSARTMNSAWQLDLAVNGRATDSLTLRALDGREDRVGFEFIREFTERLQFAFSTFARQVTIGNQDFGNGYGADVDVAYRLNRNWRKTNVAIAYSASYSRFNPEDSWKPGSEYPTSTISGIAPSTIAAELIDLEYHRHGIELRLDSLIGTTLVPYATAGIHYRFDGVGFEYGVAGGFDSYLSSDTTLTLDASYYSSGQAGNSGAGTIEAAASLRHAF